MHMHVTGTREVTENLQSSLFTDYCLHRITLKQNNLICVMILDIQTQFSCQK